MSHHASLIRYDVMGIQGEETVNLTTPVEQRARVFISCGQAKGTDEETIAVEIGRRVAELGFAAD